LRKINETVMARGNEAGEHAGKGQLGRCGGGGLMQIVPNGNDGRKKLGGSKRSD